MMLLLVPCPPQRSTIEGHLADSRDQWVAWWLQTAAVEDRPTDNGGWQFLGTWHREAVGVGHTEGRGQWAVGS